MQECKPSSNSRKARLHAAAATGGTNVLPVVSGVRRGADGEGRMAKNSRRRRSEAAEIRLQARLIACNLVTLTRRSTPAEMLRGSRR